MLNFVYLRSFMWLYFRSLFELVTSIEIDENLKVDKENKKYVCVCVFVDGFDM